MKMQRVKGVIAQLVSVALICVGFMQFSFAGAISTEYLTDAQTREASIERIEVLLAREDLAKQFAALGVDGDLVQERIQGLSNSELIMLQQQLDNQVAGGGALGVIGAVFLVLMILELVGVTDIFKSF